MSFDVRTRLSRLTASARKRNIRVNLDINKYQVLIDQGCYFCGCDLSNQNGYCLDRVDNNRGYVITNVVPCCKICNRAKSDMDPLDFTDWLQRANNHLQKKITILDDLKKLGLTQEMYDKITLALINEAVKDKQKERIIFEDIVCIT